MVGVIFNPSLRLQATNFPKNAAQVAWKVRIKILLLRDCVYPGQPEEPIPAWPEAPARERPHKKRSTSKNIRFWGYNRISHNTYFWRTHQQQEIDYLEEYNGLLAAYEFKWNPNKTAKPSATFTNAYPEATVKWITPEQHPAFLLPTESTV